MSSEYWTQRAMRVSLFVTNSEKSVTSWKAKFLTKKTPFTCVHTTWYRKKVSPMACERLELVFSKDRAWKYFVWYLYTYYSLMHSYVHMYSYYFILLFMFFFDFLCFPNAAGKPCNSVAKKSSLFFLPVSSCLLYYSPPFCFFHSLCMILECWFC